MSEVKRHPMTLKPVLYTLPGMADVAVRQVAYGEGVVIDLYTPAGASGRLPGLNALIDRFVPAAIARGLPLTLVNHPTGPHSFELLDDSPTTRAVVQQVLAFLQIHVAA
jgi:hypothetical protein